MYKLIALLIDGSSFESKFTYLNADKLLIESRVQEMVYTSNNIIHKDRLVSAVEAATETNKFYFKINYNEKYNFEMKQITEEEFKQIKPTPIFVVKFKEESNEYAMEETYDHVSYL